MSISIEFDKTRKMQSKLFRLEVQSATNLRSRAVFGENYICFEWGKSNNNICRARGTATRTAP